MTEKKKKPVHVRTIIVAMSPRRRAKIARRAAKLIAKAKRIMPKIIAKARSDR